MVDEGPAEVSCAKPYKGTFFATCPEEPGKPWQNCRFYFLLEMK